MADIKQSPAAAAKLPPPPELGEELTYMPGEGDPSTCKWRGLEFKANVPVTVRESERPGMIAAARGNRFFRVGSEKGPTENFGPPKTAMEYRAHVVDWMKEVSTVDQLVAHWAADRQLRQTCEVGHDDISFLGTLAEPKLKQMRMAEGLSESQVAELWLKHGELTIPWRS